MSILVNAMQLLKQALEIAPVPVMLVLVPGGVVGLAVVATGLAWVAEKLLSRQH